MRHGPGIDVDCDTGGCKSTRWVACSRGLLDYGVVDIDLELRSLGWRVEDGRDICPDCAEKEAES